MYIQSYCSFACKCIRFTSMLGVYIYITKHLYVYIGYLKDIDRYTVGRCWKWKVSRPFENWILCKEWGISENC